MLNFTNWLTEIAGNKAIKGNDLRVFLVLLGQADTHRNSEITQVEIAKKLKIKPQQVNRSIQNLEENGVIKRLKINRLTYGFKLTTSHDNSEPYREKG